MSDSLIITGSNYEQPTTGLQPAVFSLIEDIGITTGKYGEKNQIVIFWELSEKMREGDNEGKPFVFSEQNSGKCWPHIEVKKSWIRKQLKKVLMFIF